MATTIGGTDEGPLTMAGACERWQRAFTNITLNDAQVAAVLGLLVEEIAGTFPEMAAAVSEMASDFATHAESISSEGYQQFCG